MMYPLVRELANDKIPVVVACEVLGFTPQAFYKWEANPVSDRDWETARLINAAIDVHHDDPAFYTGCVFCGLFGHYLSASGINRCPANDNRDMLQL